METIFWGGLLRIAEAAFAGAPTLLVGLLVAGVFRRLVGPELTLRVFGGNTWRSLPQAWAWGMLLPVCSLGVIPVAYELRRAGLSGGAILAFALTAPLFNPLSLMYGLTLAEPVVIISFALGSLLVVTVVGLVWDHLFPHTAQPAKNPRPIPPGLGRMASVAVTSARYMAGPTLVFCAIGLSGSMLLCAIFPHGSLGSSMAHTDRLAPLHMLIVAIPAYATPLDVMMQVGGMFVHGNSVGAAYVLLALGAGVNLGLIAWAGRTYGFRKALTFLALFVTVVIAIAYTVEGPLYSAGDVDRPHTHAFDVYTCPFRPGQTDLPLKAWRMLVDNTPLYQVLALGGVAAALFCGVMLRLGDPRGQVEEFLAGVSEKAAQKGSPLSVDVPGPVLGGVAILGLVAASVVGCFIYYPSPEETLEDMRIAHVDVLSYAATKDVEKAVISIARYDDLTRRLQVGYALRRGKLEEYKRLKAKLLRGYLEQLKDSLEVGEFDRVDMLRRKLSAAHRRCADTFRTKSQFETL